jgi:hypothetical protein
MLKTGFFVGQSLSWFLSPHAIACPTAIPTTRDIKHQKPKNHPKNSRLDIFPPVR